MRAAGWVAADEAVSGLDPLEHEEAEVSMIALDNRAAWWSRAACSTTDPEMFFPISPAGPAVRQVAQAKAICARCEIRQACLEYALDTGPIQGVWGGTTERERQLLRQRTRRARVRQAQEQRAGRAFARQGVT
jgi:WhiB family redox-sensing transcriptional regulator